MFLFWCHLFYMTCELRMVLTFLKNYWKKKKNAWSHYVRSTKPKIFTSGLLQKNSLPTPYLEDFPEDNMFVRVVLTTINYKPLNFKGFS